MAQLRQDPLEPTARLSEALTRTSKLERIISLNSHNSRKPPTGNERALKKYLTLNL
jgi:hypothetical protein